MTKTRIETKVGLSILRLFNFSSKKRGYRYRYVGIYRHTMQCRMLIFNCSYKIAPRPAMQNREKPPTQCLNHNIRRTNNSKERDECAEIYARQRHSSSMGMGVRSVNSTVLFNCTASSSSSDLMLAVLSGVGIGLVGTDLSATGLSDIGLELIC